MGVFLIAAGLFSFWARKGISEAMTASQLWGLYGPVTPRAAALMGVAFIIVGVLILFGG